MPRVWCRTSRGFSSLEALLSVVIFGMVVTATVGALIYGQESVSRAGDNIRADNLAEEGLEAVRSIRDADYNSLTNGAYGLAQTGGLWSLAGSQDTSGIFTRQIAISDAGTDRKLVTASVSWPRIHGTGQTSAQTILSNWQSAIVGMESWDTPRVAGGGDASSSNNAVKVATQGNYAYLVLQGGNPDFIVFDVSSPGSPVQLGGLNLNGTPSNIAVSGNYAYVSSSSNSQELQIVDISNPASPAPVGSYNASGNTNALGVFVDGNTAYLTRASSGSSDELSIINVSNPNSPSLSSSYDNNQDMYEVYVANNYAYVATESNSQELMVIALWWFFPFLIGSYDLPGSSNALTIDGFGSNLLIGQSDGSLHSLSVSNPWSPSLLDSLSLSGASSVNDVVSNGVDYAFVATNANTNEFRTIDITDLSNLNQAGADDIPGNNTLNGVAYSSGLDIVPGASTSNSQELVIFEPGSP